MTLGVLFTLNYLPANYALLYMPYHIQVIAKNTRYIFVIVIGVFFSRVKKGEDIKLGVSKVFIGVLITTGALIFTLFRAVYLCLFRIRRNISNRLTKTNGLAMY